MTTTDYQGPDSQKIRKMFSSVAGGYDTANTVLSLGIHHLWRKKAVQYAQVFPGESVLDCATGTGDLAIEFKKAVGSKGRVIGTDFCKEMIDFAPLKAKQQGLSVEFSVEDVTQLPYADNSFDVCSISFGIRNVQDPKKGLQELYRVLKPQGRLIVLEFGQMNLPVISQIYGFYSQHILPKIGGLITGDSGAYSYLQESSAKFPSGEAFAQWMRDSGDYIEVDFQTLSMGIAYLYRGIKK